MPENGKHGTVDVRLLNLIEQLQLISDRKVSGKVVINFINGTPEDIEWPNKVRLYQKELIDSSRHLT
jgi:hypothetical protein